MLEDIGSSNGKDNAQELNGKPFIVVGIGASAGGVMALRKFFENVPAHSGIAYVVILHLSPDYESSLAEILSAAAAIPVAQVTEKVQIVPDRGYVISPNRHLAMEDGYLLVSPNLSVEDRRAPVDIFFRTLAVSHSSRAVCVVLSGTGANGSMGLKRVKELGGTVFVQDPEEAEFGEMPRNSIDTLLVDAVLPVAAIPAAILRYKDKLFKTPEEPDPQNISDDQQRALRDVLMQLRVRTGNDFTNYKRPTLLRRIERRINLHNLAGFREYATLLTGNPTETTALLKDMLISVTNFFRDFSSFQALEQEFLPAMFKGKTGRDQVRIWSAGCATGEEAYSLAMLCAEITANVLDVPRIQIFATDIDEEAIGHAREGLYTLNDAADVSPERLRRFFNKEAGGYRVRREIREMVLFATHNFLKDPPFSHLDMISCRNVLIYLNRAAQERVLDTFHFALNTSGVLFLGSSESIDVGSTLYDVANREHHIFRTRSAGQLIYPVPESVPRLHLPVAENTTLQQPRSGRFVDNVASSELHQRLLEEYAPPSLIVNEEYTLLHVSDRAAGYLHFQGGEPSQNLLTVIIDDLKLELRNALYQAVQQRRPVVSRGLAITRDGEHNIINLHIKPVFREHNAPNGIILVVFEDVQNATAEEQPVVRSDEFVSQHLEDELVRLRQLLRNNNQEHEFRGEELKASNEELQAMNEEMRSAAEELETSKEELQSMNEELRTVNQELKVKIEETILNNNNLQNLINSVNIATLFLDRSFRIAMFTPASRDIFNLIPSDFGRPISDITHKLRYNGFLQDAEAVMEKLVPVEKEVSSADDGFYIMRISPYRTAENQINGVVLTFIDITARKRSEETLRRSEERFRLLSESGLIGIAFFDANGTFTDANNAFLDITGYSRRHIHQKSLSWSTITPPESPQKVIIEMQELKNKGVITPREWEYLRGNGRKAWGLFGATRFEGREEGLGFMVDISDIKELERQKDIFIGIASHELKTPATAIRSYTELLTEMLQDSISPEAESMFVKLNRQVNRMVTLINTLLDTSRISEGQLSLQKSSFDLAGLIREETEEIQRSTPSHTIQVQLAETEPVYADRNRIRQVLTNLLSNAIKYSPRAREVIIAAQEQNGGVMVKIQDFGMGMDEETQKRVFDRFFRFESGSGEGLGLGLYVASEIIKKHNGHIRVNSTRGIGSVFSFWLPAQRNEQGQP